MARHTARRPLPVNHRLEIARGLATLQGEAL